MFCRIDPDRLPAPQYIDTMPRRPHLAWLVLAATFLVLLAGAGIRATPSVLIVPLEEEFGWSRSTISLAISVNILLYGLMGPFAGGLMQRLGIRRTTLGALALLAAGVALATRVTAPWQLVLVWGVVVGVGSGMVALVLGATVVNRWFVTRRGLAMGLLTASTATGQLVFLPLLAGVIERHGWRAGRAGGARRTHSPDRGPGSGCSPSGTGSTGSPPCRRRCVWPPTPSAPSARRSCSAGLARGTRWAPR
jgi:sugar phosphate permease